MRAIVLVWFLPLVAVLVALPCRAEPLGVGLPEVSPSVDLLESAELLPRFVRAAICAPLLSEGTGDGPISAQGDYSLVSDSYSVSADYGRWAFRIKSTARFSDGSRVRPEDVTYSLSRCAERGDLSGMQTVQGFSEGEVPCVEITVRPQGVEFARRMRAELARCPILQRSTALLFGDALGVGSNLVCGGAYAIASLTPGKRYLLTRMRRSPNDRKGEDEIELRGFSGLEPGLSALRVGTIGALVSPDPAGAERVREDETLEVKRCPNYWLIKRRDVVVDCLEEHPLWGRRK